MKWLIGPMGIENILTMLWCDVDLCPTGCTLNCSLCDSYCGIKMGEKTRNCFVNIYAYDY